MREILFDTMTAAEVAELLRVIREKQQALNLVALTTARMGGCAPTDRVGLNEAGTGVVIVPTEVSPPLPPSRGDGVEPGEGAEETEDEKVERLARAVRKRPL